MRHLHGAQYTFPVGKKKREEKLKKKALKEWEERRPKTFREALKYFPGIFFRTTLVVMAATLLILFTGVLGLAWAQSMWFQILVYLGFYLLFQRFIMGPLAPPRIK
ncbi:hypothetical protein CSW40_01365 [Thermus scotoductus]|uniref:Uncharacterized protein n=1 Tax=Thermus scotoductus TaxID=37636 RepID=A0A430S345_THESC|nr:hypothetical protein CSW40_01365 [Thermus scotoductus]